MGAFLVEHLAGVQAHRAWSDVRKVIFDLIVLHHAVLGYDLFQEQAKLRNVPVTIAQFVKQPAFGISGSNPECPIERAARSDHAQVLVEHQNRFTNRIYDRLRKRARFFDLG